MLTLETPSGYDLYMYNHHSLAFLTFTPKRSYNVLEITSRGVPETVFSIYLVYLCSFVTVYKDKWANQKAFLYCFVLYVNEQRL